MASRYLAVFTNRRMLVTFLLGFSGGLPLALLGGTLQGWLADAKVDIATIGLFSLVGLPYAVKFLWGPLMDSNPLPFLGLRRGWMVTSQVGLLGATIGLALCNPASNITLFSCMAFLVAFFSASQDIVIDAYRTEIVEDKQELGAAASTYVTGYRVALVVSGGLAMILADHMSWKAVYILMAAVNCVGLVTILCSKEPTQTKKVRVTSFRDSVVMPFMEFFQRQGAMEILIFIMVYKISTLMATSLTTNFLLELGYTKTLIGTVNKGAGLIATILGTLSGGSLMAKFGLKRSLWIFGVVQSLVGVTFCALSFLAAQDGAMKHVWLVVIVSLDNYMMGLGTAALVGFMMNFASRQFTATQYALLTSVMAVSRVILVAHSGDVVKLIGWNWFYIATVPLAIPGLLLLNRFDQWQTMSTVTRARLPKFDIFLILTFVVSLLLLSSEPAWQLFKMKEQATQSTLAGAIGVVFVVFAGLIRPYIQLKPRLVREST